MKCTKCTSWIHFKCAGMPQGHQIWNCDKCGGNAVITSHSRRSSIPLNVSTAVNDANNLANNQIMRELMELKRFNNIFLERISAMDNRLRSIVVVHQEEISSLKRINMELTAEINSMKICQEMSTSAGEIATHQKMSLVSDFESVSLSEFGSSLDLPTSVDRLEIAPQITRRVIENTSSFNGESSQSVPGRIGFNSGSNVEVEESLPLFSPSSLLSAVDPKKQIFLSHLHPQTSSDEIISHIMQKIKVDRSFLSCLKITPRTIANPYFSAFKLDVPESVFDIVVSSDFWPSKAVSREFTEKNKRKPNFYNRVTHN